MTRTVHDPLPYPFGPGTGLVPHPRYAQLRQDTGLARITMPFGGDAWLVTRHADAKTVLADRRFSRAAAAGKDTPRARPPADFPDQLISMDPPEHTRIRSLVSQAFTPRRVAQLRTPILRITADLADQMIHGGRPADLAEALAWPMPMTVICELLGVPATRRADVRRWTETTMALGVDVSAHDMALARDHLNDYLAELIDQRRQTPSDDMLSDLVAARDADDRRLSEQELIRLGVTLVISGHETTANQLGNFMFLLLSVPDRWDYLVRHPDHAPQVVEELLRYTLISASADFARIALEDVEVGGQLIRAGEAVLVEMHAANRDPTVFDKPDELDFTRPANLHLAFGHGVHHCLGAPLARMELQLGLQTLAHRIPNLRLAIPADQVRWRTDRLANGVTALPVAW